MVEVDNETEEVRPDLEEEEGGPVKSFLEHLEDLRWVLIKSASAVGIGMILCLMAANQIVGILMWPLERSAAKSVAKGERSITFILGKTSLGTHSVPKSDLGALGVAWPDQSTFTFTTAQIGTNTVLALRPVTNTVAVHHPKSPVQLVNLGPAGGFFVAFQVAFYGGLVAVSPLILYFVGQFVVPALKRNEKKYLFRGLGIGTVLFFTGVAFCYFFLMPMVLALSRTYSEWLGFSADQWRSEEYISFVCKFMLGMGLGFEMPVVILILVKLGLVTAEQLAKFRPYMVVINLILGAVLTTPEVITQITMFIPLQLLYEVSIWIARHWERQEKRREAALESTISGSD